jgi:hypothetical protein
MLGRIRQASGNFDFSALTGGRRRESRSPVATGTADSLTVEPVAYNPIYVPDETDPVPPLSELWKQPETKESEPAVIQVPEWERAKARPQPGGLPFPTIYGHAEDDDKFAPRSRPRRRRRERVPFARAALTRLMLCLWTVLFGASLGVGAGPVVESTTSYRALPAFGATNVSPAKPVKKTAAKSKSRRSAKAAKPAANANKVDSSKSKPGPWADYQTPLTIPLAAILVIGLLWIFGAPNVLGDHDSKGYWFSAFVVFGLSLWCGLAGMMTTLELRSSQPKAQKTAFYPSVHEAESPA